MSTSNSNNFTATRNQIIRQSALDLKAISAGATMSAEMITDFAFRLNAMVKEWNATGIHVWTIEEATLFPQPGQAVYELGLTSPDHVTEAYVQTALSVDAAAGATSISVDDDDGILDNDHIGIVLDDGSIFWTTVNGTPASNVVNLDAALTDSASTAQKVFAYTTKIDTPLEIPSVRRYEIAGARDVGISPISRIDFRNLPNKTQRGTITQYFYDQRRDNGLLNLWQTPQNADSLVNFTWHRAIQDFDTAGDNADLPQEWISTLIANLAYEMRHQYPLTPLRARELQLSALTKLDTMKGFDREGESVFFQPDT